MGDRFGLEKLLTKATQGKVDVGDSGKLKVIVKEASAFEDLLDSAENAARKVSSIMKRGGQPDIKAYTEARKLAVDRAKKTESMVAQFGDALGKKQHEAKKAGKTDDAKLIGELDKQLDEFADALGDTKKLPKPEEFMLALVSGRISVEKKGAKDGEIKHVGKIDDDKPGTSFAQEVAKLSKEASDYDFKPLTGQTAAIKGLDVVVSKSADFEKHLVPMEAFLQKPTAQGNPKVAALAKALDGMIQEANKAYAKAADIEKAVNKLAKKTDREKSVATSITKSWDKVQDALTAAKRVYAKYDRPQPAPSEVYGRALKDAEKAAAKRGAA